MGVLEVCCEQRRWDEPSGSIEDEDSFENINIY
jgi:hypothetical protein